jgi:hypothetical protein
VFSQLLGVGAFGKAKNVHVEQRAVWLNYLASAHPALTVTHVVAPARSIASIITMIVSHDVPTTDFVTDEATDHRTGRSCNHGTNARADVDAFQCSGLCGDGRGQKQ